ncbi:MAG: thiamine phosphate synthase [Nitrospirae bacterium]|nr:thiamine phosphate synthase [Nitrospirota bacterium]
MKPDFDIYLITDRTKTDGRDLKDIIAEALRGGIRGVQLREKDLPTRGLLSLAAKLREITRKAGARLLINGRIDICLAVEADGVHIGKDSIPADIARGILGSNKIIGVSAHSLSEALMAQSQGADFITLGPIYHTESKAQYGAPLGIDMINSVRESIEIPIFAIGGIRTDNIRPLTEAGAYGIAMISAIISAGDIKDAAMEFVSKMKSFKEGRCPRVNP